MYMRIEYKIKIEFKIWEKILLINGVGIFNSYLEKTLDLYLTPYTQTNSRGSNI